MVGSEDSKIEELHISFESLKPCKIKGLDWSNWGAFEIIIIVVGNKVLSRWMYMNIHEEEWGQVVQKKKLTTNWTC